MLQLNERYYVYRNLSRAVPEVWSLMLRGRVAGRAFHARLEDVEFRVRPGGRAEVLRKHQRGVHAFAIGRLTHHQPKSPPGTPTGHVQVTYNPFHAGHFFELKSGRGVGHADFVEIDDRGRLWAKGVTHAEPIP